MIHLLVVRPQILERPRLFSVQYCTQEPGSIFPIVVDKTTTPFSAILREAFVDYAVNIGLCKLGRNPFLLYDIPETHQFGLVGPDNVMGKNPHYVRMVKQRAVYISEIIHSTYQICSSICDRRSKQCHARAFACSAGVPNRSTASLYAFMGSVPFFTRSYVT